MRVKRFVAPTMSEAVALVKAEFGPDAVILNTGKTRQPGWLGFFRARWVAVTAGCDETIQALPELSAAPMQTYRKPEVGQPEEPLLPSLAAETPEEAAEKQIAAAEEAVEKTREVTVEETAEPVAEEDTPAQAVAEDVPKPNSAVKLSELTVNYLLERLRQQDVAPHHLDELREELRARVRQGGEAPRIQLVRLLAEHMPAAEPWPAGDTPLVVPLVGPTGVGKTTTIAKLATTYALLSGWRVGFITADTYRVAAVEQLRTYADILDVPMEVVYSPDDIGPALERLADRQLVLMDTAGRSHYSEEHMEELQEFLAALGECRTHLVLNATTRYGDLVEAIDSFSSCVPVEGLIITKLDETKAYGALYNAVRRMQKPIAFVANGQSVPEDLESADPLRLAGLLVGVEQ